MAGPTTSNLCTEHTAYINNQSLHIFIAPDSDQNFSMDPASAACAVSNVLSDHIDKMALLTLR
ncbi:hypothetical protein CLU79DRAFT_838274 [Phycomyces nitens]|nr:hypothetical protein CLU79DRAFT_838274 [Phycomyces nitens]